MKFNKHGQTGKEEKSSIPSSAAITAVTNIPTTSFLERDYPVMRQLLTESSTCGVARKVLLGCGFRISYITYLHVHQYIITYEMTILYPWSYHFSITVSYELKMDGAVLKGVCDVPYTVTMNARQTIKAVIHESKHVWNYSVVYHYSSL